MNDIVLAGRKFSSRELSQLKEICRDCGNLSRKELALTICENFDWKTPRGKLKVDSCLNALNYLSDKGLCKVPELRYSNKWSEKIKFSARTSAEKHLPMEFSVEHLEGISLVKVETKSDRALWKEYVDRYHYLRFRRCVGSFLQYFIFAHYKGQQHKVGCMQWASSSISNLKLRDEWIDWEQEDRGQRLHLILNNNRFLIFPWIKVKNLASKTLSIAAKQVPEDFLDVYKYRPVLLETFVDSEKYSGACYTAAGWSFIGKTAGLGRMGKYNEPKEAIKLFYMKPLNKYFRNTLKDCTPKVKRKKKAKPKVQKGLRNKTRGEQCNTTPPDEFIDLWTRVMSIVSNVAYKYDQQWRQRRRVIDTTLLILLIFRLVFSKNRQGYRTTIDELWLQCREMGIDLPQEPPIAASSFSAARSKLDAEVFREINDHILRQYNPRYSDQYKWKGYDVFAVDGSKINLPAETIKNGFEIYQTGAHYPVGLVSCLYQVRSLLPYDFDLVSHNDERKCAITHLKKLHAGKDLVIYDRGYFSYAMLYHHQQASVPAVFRLSTSSGDQIKAFIESEDNDRIISYRVGKSQEYDIKRDHPDIEYKPLQLRLLKYRFDNTEYYIATTLLDTKTYLIHDFSDLYHTRWRIEEFYKIVKEFIQVNDFHAKSLRGIKQEISASFVLVTLTRLFSNQIDSTLSEQTTKIEKHPFKVNFKNALAVVMRSIEHLIIETSNKVRETLQGVLQTISRQKQKIRPMRQQERITKRSEKKSYNKTTKEKKKLPQVVYV